MKSGRLSNSLAISGNPILWRVLVILSKSLANSLISVEVFVSYSTSKLEKVSFDSPFSVVGASGGNIDSILSWAIEKLSPWVIVETLPTILEVILLSSVWVNVIVAPGFILSGDWMFIDIIPVAKGILTVPKVSVIGIVLPVEFTAVAFACLFPSTKLKDSNALVISFNLLWTPPNTFATPLPGGNAWLTANIRGLHKS